MRTYGTAHKRLFGQWRVTITGYKISIVGNWYSNYGLIYPHMATRWADGEECQVIGMDNGYGLTKQALEYIHDYIRKHHKAIARSTQ